jgi:hypothetical protein
MEKALTRLQPKPKNPGKGGPVLEIGTESNKLLDPEVLSTMIVVKEKFEETNANSTQHPTEAEELLSPTNKVCNLKTVPSSDSQTDPAGKKDRHIEISSNQQQQGNHPLCLYCEQSENGINSTNKPGHPDNKPLGETTVDGLGTTRGLGREAQRTEISPPNTQPSNRKDEAKRGEAPDLNHKSCAFEMSHPSKSSRKATRKGEAPDLNHKGDAVEISHLSMPNAALIEEGEAPDLNHKGDAVEISHPDAEKKEECRCNDRSKTQTKTPEENEKIRRAMIMKLKINLQQTIKDRKSKDVEKLTDFIIDHEKKVLPDGILDLSVQPAYGFNFEIILTETTELETKIR